MLHLRRPAALLAFAGVLAAVGLLVAMPATAVNNLGIVNGSFQTCDLQGWTATPAVGGTDPATVSVQPGGVDGNCMGVITTGGGAYVNPGSAPGDDSILQHDNFWATSGTKITVYAYFSGDCGFDEASLQLDGEGSGEQDVICGGGWHLYSWTTDYTGYHTFLAEASNEFDAFFSSTLQIDVLKASGLHKV